ncbi:MAG: hypothetical protein KC421_18530 [Anaerolineales bacterium]|nr:hypothetical protein [Anaerolineales bacterium]
MNTQNGRSALIRSAFIVLVALMGMVTVLPEDALAQFSGWIRCSLGSRDVCFTDGNVGIGTTNPLAPLSISNGLGDKISLWDSGSIDRMHGFGIKDSTLAFVMPNPESHPHFWGFYAREGGTDSRVAYIDTTGQAYFSSNVGIGDENPNSKLEVKDGYLELDTSDGRPPDSDCDSPNEVGRMKVDSTRPYLYVCMAQGWTRK